MSEAPKTVSLSVRMPPHIAKLVQEVAVFEDRSRAKQIVHYICQGLERDGFLSRPRKPRLD